MMEHDNGGLGPEIFQELAEAEQAIGIHFDDAMSKAKKGQADNQDPRP